MLSFELRAAANSAAGGCHPRAGDSFDQASIPSAIARTPFPALLVLAFVYLILTPLSVGRFAARCQP